ncbi:YajG family lipoprotein [Aestuariibacter sp. AA17]|uniref:YajG family lipoprotein n=1 Tax=Fluctibacter corallii TaxID=2984329 RepID=A0ABT3A4R5_9ALTE|nr:YajG family lipoprotein [Aestuariibacter sp. AA17]MCV2883677.1 YajG family lipoprotein [Aestuariibacter sp. AA17]
MRKKMLLNLLGVMSLVGMMAGCSVTPQIVVLEPALTIQSSSIGSEQAVSVKISDVRLQKYLGMVGKKGEKQAPIMTSEPLENIVKEAVSEGLARKGFRITDGADMTLSIAIQSFQYERVDEDWTKGVIIKSVMDIKAEKPTGNMKKTFRSEQEERVVFSPDEEKNAKWLNEALSRALSKILSDEDLLVYISTH